MAQVHVYSSFTYSYLSRARALARSVRRHNPGFKLWAFIVDKPPASMEDHTWRHDFDYVIDAETLYGEEWESWIFKHNIVEACTAIKGRALTHLLEAGADRIIYLDPDIAVFNSLSPIVSALEKNSVILTPHQVEPNETDQEIVDNEITSMKYGIFNLGFLAVNNDANGRSMAKWWDHCLYRACYDDVPNGIFTDQKYCDHVPGLFSRVRVERDPGYNVASWNLSRRRVRISETGSVLVNNEFLLRFYHFTKINSEGDVMTFRYARNNADVLEIWFWYKREIAALQVEGIPPRYWYYGLYENGEPVAYSDRVMYRTQPQLMELFPRPRCVGADSFHSRTRSNAASI